MVMKIRTVKKTMLEGDCLLLAGAACGSKFGFPGVSSNSGDLAGNIRFNMREKCVLGASLTGCDAPFPSECGLCEIFVPERPGCMVNFSL